MREECLLLESRAWGAFGALGLCVYVVHFHGVWDERVHGWSHFGVWMES